MIEEDKEEIGLSSFIIIIDLSWLHHYYIGRPSPTYAISWDDE